MAFLSFLFKILTKIYFDGYQTKIFFKALC